MSSTNTKSQEPVAATTPKKVVLGAKNLGEFLLKDENISHFHKALVHIATAYKSEPQSFADFDDNAKNTILALHDQLVVKKYPFIAQARMTVKFILDIPSVQTFLLARLEESQNKNKKS